MKTALYIIVPLGIIFALYLVFFGLGKKSGTQTRINDIDQILHTGRLSTDEVIKLNLEKKLFQKKL